MDVVAHELPAIAVAPAFPRHQRTTDRLDVYDPVTFYYGATSSPRARRRKSH